MSNRWDLKSRGARIHLVCWIVALFLATISYRILVVKHLEQSSLLFIGIPALLAIVVTLFSEPKSITGTIISVITVALCISGIFLGEGFICIVMASPLFYLVGLFIGWALEAAKKRRQKTTMTCLLVVAFLPISFEGTSSRFSLDREETVSAERTVEGTPSDVASLLSKTPRITDQLPPFLRLRFPRPVHVTGTGLALGDIRRIHFAGGEGHPGDLVMKVVEVAPGYVRFDMVTDQSKIAHWLTWRSAVVEWNSIDTTHTRVKWTLSFRRDLDPAWYFRIWERYAVRLAADYLIQTNASPKTSAEVQHD
jgi:hypothetical protein